MGVRLGAEVGYSVRFEAKVSDKTKIKFMTDGLLLRELVADPTMDAYGVVMLDEAHERTLSTDILLAFLKDLIRHRTDLKLIISSATLKQCKVQCFLRRLPYFPCPRQDVSGRDPLCKRPRSELHLRFSDDRMADTSQSSNPW